MSLSQADAATLAGFVVARLDRAQLGAGVLFHPGVLSKQAFQGKRVVSGHKRHFWSTSEGCVMSSNCPETAWEGEVGEALAEPPPIRLSRVSPLPNANLWNRFFYRKLQK